MAITDRRATPHNFTLADRDGVEHSYEVTVHNTTAAAPILVELLGAFSPLLARVLAEQKKLKGMDAELSELFASPDIAEQLGAQFAAGVVKLSQPTLRAMFAHTTRDGEAMRETVKYDAVYSGNMFEWTGALFAIVKCNGFLPF